MDSPIRLRSGWEEAGRAALCRSSQIAGYVLPMYYLTRRSRNQELGCGNRGMHSHRRVKSDGNVCLLTLPSDVPALAGISAPEARKHCSI